MFLFTILLHCCCPFVLFYSFFVHSETGSQDTITTQNKKHYRLSQSDHIEIIRKSLPIFENKTLTACVVVREPFVIYTEPPDIVSNSSESREAQEDLNNYSGIAIELVKRLSDIFKFNVKVVRPKDSQFGVSVAGKGWTGLLGSLVKNESDLGVTALSITGSRAKVVDFTRAYYVETAGILLRRPEEAQNYFAIFEPFSASVWFVLMATIIILILLITIMTKLEETQLQQDKMHKLAKFLVLHSDTMSMTKLPKGDDGNDPRQDERSHSSAGEVLPQDRYSRELEIKLAAVSQAKEQQEFGSTWLQRFYYSTSCVLNILLIRDIKHPPSQTPIRILVCVWWLSTTVIVNIYFGILFGQLVVPRQPRSIETLDELVNQKQVEWCVTKGSAIYELFRRSKPGTVYGELGARMRDVSSVDEGVGKVINSGWAYIREQSMLQVKMANEHNRLRECKMQLAKERFFSVGFGLALVKGSIYVEPINSALTLMIENGFVSRWQSMYWPARNQFTECQLETLREGEPLSMKHFISIYLVCSLMVCLSLAILIYQSAHERLFSRKARAGRTKVSWAK